MHCSIFLEKVAPIDRTERVHFGIGIYRISGEQMKLIGIKGGKLQHNARNFKGNQIKIMRIRKKQCSKSIDDIGKDNYNFDFYSEIIIYKDLCCKRLTAKEKKKQVGLPNFNRYKDWKSYIVREYGVTDKEKLMEFSRYLNQRLRDQEYSLEYWKLTIPIILTLMMGDLCSGLLYNLVNIDDMVWNVLALIIALIMIVFVMGFVLVFILKIMHPTWEANVEKNFFIDFKEIVDELVDIKNDEVELESHITME